MSFFEELKRRNVIRVAIAYGVASWFILQLSDVVLENIAAPGWVMQTIMLVLAVGFPLVVIFAWAFEMTPAGLKKEKDVDRSQSITNVTGRKLDRMLIGILTLAVAYLLLDKLVLQDSSAPAEATEVASTQTGDAAASAKPVAEANPSVAVLPFVNMSGDQENEYFSDGLTETLLHMLAQLPELRVAARTSSFAFKGQNKSVSEIANTLGVAHILEGSVQKSGERVRITAQLIRADDGFHVWSQNYTRPLDDIFAIQDEIANDVASALDASLLSKSTKPLRGVETSVLTAYDSYLKGLEQQAIYSYGSLAAAEGHFKQALARDPGFTDARLALARNYLLKNQTGLLESQETIKLVEPLLAQVREQHPDNHLARALEITTTLIADETAITREEAEPLVSELRNLLPLVPTETMVRMLVANMSYFFFRDSQTALQVLEAGLMVDPLDANLYRERGRILIDLDRNDEALADLQKAQKIAPDNPNTYSSLASVEEENNDLVAALNWRRKATEVDPQDHELAAAIANILYKLELPEEGDHWFARVKALAPNSPVAKHTQIHRFLARHEFQQALELSRSMIEEQIENRRGAFGEALFTYTRLMTEQGKAGEAYEFLVSVNPDIAKFDQMPNGFNTIMMQFAAIQLLGPTEDGKQAWAKLTTILDKAGFPWREPDNFAFLMNQVFTGDIEGATNTYLNEHLNRPLATDPDMYMPKDPVLMAEIYADPRVANRMAELEAEHSQLQSQVQDLMQQPEWNL